MDIIKDMIEKGLTFDASVFVPTGKAKKDVGAITFPNAEPCSDYGTRTVNRLAANRPAVIRTINDIAYVTVGNVNETREAFLKRIAEHYAKETEKAKRENAAPVATEATTAKRKKKQQ